MKLNVFGKNKRGSIVDPIFSGAYILKIGITLLIVLFIWVSFQSGMADTVSGTSSSAIVNSVMDSLRAAYFSSDYVFPLLVGGMLILSVVFAFRVGANIIWGMFSLILWAVTVVLSTLYVNIYLEISDKFPTIYASMPIFDYIMTNLHWISFFWIVILTAVMFRKNNAEDDNTQIQGRFYG